MILDCSKYVGPCRCGREHTLETKKVVVEYNALDKFDQYMDEVGLTGKRAVIYDTNTYNLPTLRHVRADQEIVLNAEGLHSEKGMIEDMMRQLDHPDVIVAVGSGTIMDFGRYPAYHLGIPFVAVPTLASSDGFTANICSIIIDGQKKSIPMQAAALVVCDLNVVSGAPLWLTVSGISDILAKYQQKFNYILVDEYQDTNYAQYLIVKKLSDRHHNICVVGDDAQSIYSFRGARIENILNFKNDYPEYKLYKLEQNYRSTTTIVDAANCVISKNKEQIPKKTFSQNEEGEKIKVLRALSDKEEGFQVTNEIFRLANYEQQEYSDFAILYRTNAQSRILEEALRKRNIPYKIYGGQSFYQRKEIKDLLAYFRLTVNQNDEEAFKRIINYPRRGIGDSTVDKIREIAGKYHVSLWTVLCNLDKVAGAFNSGTLSKLQKFGSLIERFREQIANENAYDAAVIIARSSGIIDDLSNDETPEGVSRKENIQELLNGIKDFSETAYKEGKDDKLPAFLEGVALLTDQDGDKEGDQNKVTLMTIHASKGLEFSNVFITGLEEELFPAQQCVTTPAALEEERRLFYVALTRAEKRAFMSFATSRYKNGQVVSSRPSRFIGEIDQEFLEGYIAMREEPSGFKLKTTTAMSGLHKPAITLNKPATIDIPAIDRSTPIRSFPV